MSTSSIFPSPATKPVGNSTSPQTKLNEAPPFTIYGLTTPPESPVDATLPPYSKSVNVTAGPSNMIVAGGVVYPSSQIQMMAEQLLQARRNGEYPTTTASPLDAAVVVEDYDFLARLRAARGANPNDAAPEAYKKLRVEVARRIAERDSSHNDEEHKQEAARRVNTYLRSVQQERRYFDAANTMLQKRGVKNPTQLDLDNITEEIFAIVEHAAEQTMADAAAPLRMNIGKLGVETADYKKNNDALGNHLEALGRQNDTCSRQNDAYTRHNETFTRQNEVHSEAFKQQKDALAQQHDTFGRQNEVLTQQISEHKDVFNKQISQQNDVFVQQINQQEELLSQQTDTFASQNDTLGRYNEAFAEHVTLQSEVFIAQNDAFARQNDTLARLEERFTQQLSTLSQQNNIHQATIQVQSSNISALENMLETQTRNAQIMNDQITSVVSLVNHISQRLLNLPEAVQDLVYHASRDQTNESIAKIMLVQQRVMLELEQEARQRETGLRAEQYGELHLGGRGSQDTAVDGAAEEQDVEQGQELLLKRASQGVKGRGNVRKLIRNVFRRRQ
ncbi:hypothetical protein G7046_g4435 [Stylonectria norvegica]|nr:hypothetical protein G7046_g4435 [Stylonectria norvegica]